MKVKKIVHKGYMQPDKIARQFLTQAITQALNEVVPEKMTMRAALETRSEVGAGYTIGHNACRQKVLDNINNYLKQ